jgi:hypothetical protein
MKPVDRAYITTIITTMSMWTPEPWTKKPTDSKVVYSGSCIILAERNAWKDSATPPWFVVKSTL